jgi:hypothetical protein
MFISKKMFSKVRRLFGIILLNGIWIKYTGDLAKWEEI